MKTKTIEFDNGIFKIVVQESCEKVPVGVIIDIFNSKTEDILDSITLWNHDLEEEDEY